MWLSLLDLRNTAHQKRSKDILQRSNFKPTVICIQRLNSEITEYMIRSINRSAYLATDYGFTLCNFNVPH